MAKYRKIYPRIWDSPDFELLTTSERLVAIHILTGPHTNRVGLFKINPDLAAAYCGMTSKQFRNHIETVSKRFGWAWDNGSRTIFIPSWMRWNAPENPNVIAGLANEASELPASPFWVHVSEFRNDLTQNLLRAWDDKVEPILKRYRNGFETVTQTVSKPLPKPFRTPNHNQTITKPEPEPNQTKHASGGDSFEAPSDDFEPASKGAHFEAVNLVAEHYKSYHPKAVVGEKERGKIRDRLKEGFTAEQLKSAIDGNHRSPWHCGKNESRAKYHSLGLICRDADKANSFIEIAERLPRGPTPGDNLTAKTRQTMEAVASWLDEGGE